MDNIIEISNLKKTYKDGTEAIKGINLKIQKGVVYGLLGENGAGKSTMISILTTLCLKTTGKVYINELDLDKDEEKIRNIIGVTFQESIKEGDLTGYEILENHGQLYGMKSYEIKEKAEKLLDLVELKDVSNKLTKTYSGGMIRRLDIIRGMMTSPKILFLDEPTLGLDPKSRKKMWEMIKGLKEDNETTFFVTSHYIDEIEKNTDKIAIINKGKIIKEGSPLELVREFRREKKLENCNLEEVFLYLIEENQGG